MTNDEFREYSRRTEKRDIAILIGIGVALSIISYVVLRSLGAV